MVHTFPQFLSVYLLVFIAYAITVYLLFLPFPTSTPLHLHYFKECVFYMKFFFCNPYFFKLLYL